MVYWQWVLQQAAALPDTLVMRVVEPDLSWFTRLTDLAGDVAKLLPYILLGVAIWAFVRLRKAFEQASASMDEIGGNLRELLTNANEVAENVAGITSKIHDEVGELKETVGLANRRARRAVSQLADRADELNATIELVQENTQGLVIGTLSAFKGVRAGLAALRQKPKKRRRHALDEEIGADDEDMPPDLPARPRLRRRSRGGN